MHGSVFIPIDRWTLILKNGEKWSFSYENKVSIYLSQWAEWICGAKSLKEKRLLCECMFILIERRTLIIKIVERKVFPMKPKYQYQLSQLGEYVYGS